MAVGDYDEMSECPLAWSWLYNSSIDASITYQQRQNSGESKRGPTVEGLWAHVVKAQ